jgi:hypothetical protein
MRAMSPWAKCQERDLLGSRRALWALWIAPWAVILGTVNAGNLTQTVAWTLSFTVGGAACLVNARRCARRHCFYTGPAYLVAAFVSLLFGLHLLPFGRHGWTWILDAAGAVTLIACCGLEPLLGKYRTTRA